MDRRVTRTQHRRNPAGETTRVKKTNPEEGTVENTNRKEKRGKARK